MIVLEHEYVVHTALELRHLKRELVQAARPHWRQLEEVAAEDELYASEEAPVPAQPLSDQVKLPHQLRVEHRALVDDQHVRVGPPLSHIAPHRAQQLRDGALGKAKARPSVQRGATDQGRSQSRRRRHVHSNLRFAKLRRDQVQEHRLATAALPSNEDVLSTQDRAHDVQLRRLGLSPRQEVPPPMDSCTVRARDMVHGLSVTH